MYYEFMADKKLTPIKTEFIMVNEQYPHRCGKSCPYLTDVFEERSGPDYQWCKKFRMEVGMINKVATRCQSCIDQFGK